MALLILYSEQEVHMHSYVSRLLEQVNKMSCDESKLPSLRIMVDALERIYAKSDIFAYDEYMLLGMQTIKSIHPILNLN